MGYASMRSLLLVILLISCGTDKSTTVNVAVKTEAPANAPASSNSGETTIMSNLPATVKMGTVGKAAGILGIAEGYAAGDIILSPDGVSARLKAGIPQILSNKKSSSEGEALMSIGANQHALIPLPDLTMIPKRYHFIISVNPDLFKYAQVSSPGMVSYLDLQDVVLGISTFKSLDLSSLDWVFEITAID